MYNWKSTLLPDPPSVSPAELGWGADIENKTLLAQSLLGATALAPYYILKLIWCSCHSGVPCKLATAVAWEISLYVLSSVLVKLIGFVTTLTQKIQMMVMMMICTCLIMLMLISLVIDHCGEPRPWFDIISSLMIVWRVQRYWLSSVSKVFFMKI